MMKRPLSAAAISLLLLAACAIEPLPTVSAASEISRLNSLGYRVVARKSEGNTTVLRYSGPVNASVQCSQNGQVRALRPRVVSSGGSVQEFKLNSYLILSPGSDGVLSPAERDGLYVISRTTRPSARARATAVDTIAFESGYRGTFPSGLSCRAT